MRGCLNLKKNYKRTWQPDSNGKPGRTKRNVARNSGATSEAPAMTMLHAMRKEDLKWIAVHAPLFHFLFELVYNSNTGLLMKFCFCIHLKKI